MRALLVVEQPVFRAVHIVRALEEQKVFILVIKIKKPDKARAPVSRAGLQILQPHEMLARTAQSGERIQDRRG